MSFLEELIDSGRIVDIMLGFFVLEIAALIAFRGRRIRIVPMLANIGAGGSLMLALRAALTESGWTWIAFWLVAALIFHVADLNSRLRPAVPVAVSDRTGD